MLTIGYFSAMDNLGKESVLVVKGRYAYVYVW